MVEVEIPQEPDGAKPSPAKLSPAKPSLLVVILHGWSRGADNMSEVRRAVTEAFASTYDLRLHVPDLPYAKQWRSARAADVVKHVVEDITALVSANPPDKIILVGHSLGATIARRVYLEAAGCPRYFAAEAPLGSARRPWASKVERIVLLAAFNRGWKISERMGWRYAFLFNLCGLLGHIIPGWAPTIFDLRLGAPFVAQTRLNWLAYRRDQEAARLARHQDDEALHRPILVQMIGTQDNLISPFDQIDIAVDGSGRPGLSEAAPAPGDTADRDYFLVEVPFTDHPDAVRLYDGPHAAKRRELFEKAITGNRHDLHKIAFDPTLLTDEIEEIDGDVQNTVFVIHGIRDDGFWTHRIAEKVRAVGGIDPATGKTVFRSWTPSYGYFAMLPFLLPWVRREKVEWFMDQYVTAYARYPRSDFHYIGHSNGTYLVARALGDYPALHLKHVLFAGSVVRADYHWAQLVQTGRVARMQNVVASADWVVALLPKSVEWLPKLFDLGGAGFDGFDEAGSDPRISQLKYVRGGHSAGIAEEHWEQIAAFVVSGTPLSRSKAGADDELYADRRNRVIAVLAATHLGIPLIALIFFLAIPLSCLWWGGAPGLLCLVLYLIVLKFFVTRF